MRFKKECRRAEQSFWAMAAGQEGGGEAARVQTHLRDCPACRTQWEAVQQTQSGLTALRDCSIPASQTDWHQVQARITAVPEHAPAASKRRRAVPSPHRSIAGKRIGWVGATTVLAVGCLLIGTANLWREANNPTQNNAFVSADSDGKLYPLKSSPLASSPLARKTMSARVVTFTGTMSTIRKAALSRDTDKPPRDNTQTSQYQNRSRVSRYYASRGRIQLARQDTRWRLRLAAAASHRQLQAEVAAAFRTGRTPEPTAFLLITTVTRSGKVEPEYVMTTVETDMDAPRRYIIDSININAQNAGPANVDGLAVPAAPSDQGSAAATTNPNADPSSKGNTAL